MISKKAVFLGQIFLLPIYISIFGCSDSSNSSNSTSLLPEVEQSLRTQTTQFSLLNEEAPVPPQCYTKTEGVHNPCFTCHQNYDDRESVYRMNKLDDGGIQGEYAFSDIGTTNQWHNLFIDKSDWVNAISDEKILTYIAQNNYSNLPDRLKKINWTGFIPDLENFDTAKEAFDEDGLALDGSHWVAFNYKPLPSTFWPTNGSTDDVTIRLPEKFRTLNGVFNKDIYFANLSLLELNLKQIDQISIKPINENILQLDLNNDQSFSADLQTLTTTSHYFGDASDIALTLQQFPEGTEFMHSVRYVGVDENNEIVVPARMKELRYMRKVRELTESETESRYSRERKEKLTGELPSFVNHGDVGLSNGLGWDIQGFVEDYNGQLRPQNLEEQMFCMGCHSAIGSTVDSTFSFVRKVTGKDGWGYINLKGMKDAPSFTQTEGEILQYLKLAGGGNEFRENPEIRQKWYDENGSLKELEILSADVYELITPSAARALELNKAYTYIVRHQSFIDGRDSNTLPAKNVYQEIDESIPPLEPESRFFGWDIRLNWE